jgi:hypothetical protein
MKVSKILTYFHGLVKKYHRGNLSHFLRVLPVFRRGGGCCENCCAVHFINNISSSYRLRDSYGNDFVYSLGCWFKGSYS